MKIFTPPYAVGRFDNLQDKNKAVQDKVNEILNQALQMFDYKGLPPSIKQRDAELLALTNGFGILTIVDDVPKCLYGTQGGMIGDNYFPTAAFIGTPNQKDARVLKIGYDCIILPNNSLMQGIMPWANRYASLLVEAEITLRLSNITHRQQRGITCPDDRTFKSAKKYLQDLEDGKLGVLADNNSEFLDRIGNLPSDSIGANGITQIIEEIQYLQAQISNRLGLKQVANYKREALTETETTYGNDVLLPHIQDMLSCRKDAWDEFNKKYGYNVEVDLSPLWKRSWKEATETETELTEKEDNGEPK